MNLSQQLQEHMKQAMRAKDKLRLATIRMVISSVKNEEISKGASLEDSEVLDIVQRELKQRKDSLQEFEKANRHDLAETVRQEIKILERYLPKQLSADELDQIVRQTIEEAGASTKADMGKVMAALMPKVKGRADGKAISKLVQELLS